MFERIKLLAFSLGIASDAFEQPLLKDGACRNRTFAYFTRCVTTSSSFLDQCYASICSLLVTTDPACVVVYVNSWVYTHFRHVFTLSGVSVVVAPEYAPLSSSHRYAHLTGSAGNASWNRFYSFLKFEAARLTEHTKILAFDPDVLFMRNASQVELLDADFAVSRIPKGKNFSIYVNNGFMLLKPSVKTYSDLMVTWREGSYNLYYADDENGDQDVFTDLCWIRKACGTILNLDACVYSHGSWLPNSFWRACPSERVIARHNFKKAREEILTDNLANAFKLAACRRSVLPDVRSTCFANVALDEHGEPFTYERCCEARQLRKPELSNAEVRLFLDGGDPECWEGEFSYETCCLAWNTKTDELQRQLLRVGASWYGLSSIPDDPSEKLIVQQCMDEYASRERTMVSLSIHSHIARDWRTVPMPQTIFVLQYKCDLIGGRFVMFQIAWKTYFDRHPNVAALQSTGGQIQPLSACVPTSCCVNQENEHGLHFVLWRFVITYVLRLSSEYATLLPTPDPEDYLFTLTTDATTVQEWRPCKRASKL